ncbi:hypothetical protein PAXINDRAFT_168605 [Paxillus involutus ATCC 200175]|nr:hypothetical protein PAXINDRAFT_168605 [Paxillus involutus ATCC 200175]
MASKEMSGVSSTPRTTEKEFCCYDYQLRPKNHGGEQRYMSATTGKCRRLKVQATNPAPQTNQVQISDNSRKSSKLAIWLIRRPPKSAEEVLVWIGTFIWFTLSLIWPFGAPTYNGLYHPYHMRYWGQFWAARSSKEHSTRLKELVGHQMPTPAGISATTRSITHALHPRVLIIHGEKGWYKTDSSDVIINEPYIAISYRQSQVFQRGTDPAGKKREQEQKQKYIEMVRATTLACGHRAYWLDLECLGETSAEKNLDVYRMSDVYRGAAFTLITLPKSDDPLDRHDIKSWRSWGGRVWTLPEALLSSKLRYKIGFADSPVIPLTLHDLANKAYERYDEETAIINAYSGRDPLERLERLTLLKAAIWRRHSAALPQTPAQQPQNATISASEGAYPAEKVYALMGFFEHRIMPNPLESELQALARLSMANDSDRIAERMVSLLPDRIPQQACWYSDDDVYQSRLWDIEPEIQVAGVTRSGALVLDGCHAAAIRWKDFPSMAFETTYSFKRSFAGGLPYFFWQILTIGIVTVQFNTTSGAVIIVISLILMLTAPWLVAYANSGRILRAQPWFVGIKGALTAQQVSEHLYGGAMDGYPRMSYTATGTPFSVPGEATVREGNPSQFTQAAEARYGQHIYTLVDTLSGTLYYFVASRPPTVCIFAGREGGLGRFVLCSESCTINELHKESVVRMPSYISRAMLLTDWIALGGVDDHH